MIYDCQCQKCERIEEIIRSVADRDNTPICCGQQMKRIITTNYHVIPDYDFVTADITGDPVHITSKKQHDRLCKEHNSQQVYGNRWI